MWVDEKAKRWAGFDADVPVVTDVPPCRTASASTSVRKGVGRLARPIQTRTGTTVTGATWATCPRTALLPRMDQPRRDPVDVFTGCW